jgi:hypothetical protein
MLYTRTLIVTLLLLPLVEAHSAEWQYTGGTDNGSTFFDAKGVQYPDKNTVRVWIKSISYKTSDNYDKEIEGERKERFIEETAQKKARGYIPEFFLLNSVKRMYRGKSEYESAIAGAIADEVIANDVEVHPAANALFEIDCNKKRIAIFSITKYRIDGSVEKSVSTKKPKYDDILSDTTGEWLSMLVCPKATYIF